MSTPAATAPSSTLTHRQILLVFAGLMLGMLLAALDQTIVSTALPTIVADLGGLSHLSWVVTSYMLASTASTPLYGKLGDLYGRKRLFQAAIIIFLVGSVLSGMSQTMLQLILFRAIQGIGAGGLMVGAMAIVADVVPPANRGRYQGLIGAVFAVSSVVGPLLGGYFTDSWSWRWVFYINLPVGLVALVVVAMFLHVPHHHAGRTVRIDWAGAALLASAACALTLLTTWGGNEYAWLSPQILATGALSVALLIGFVLVERRVAEPVLPLRLFTNHTFTVTSVLGFIVGLAMFGSLTFLPLYLQLVDGATATGSGLKLLPLMAGLLVASIGSGQFISRHGSYRWFPRVGMLVVTGALLLLSGMDQHTGYAGQAAFMGLLGVGIGLTMQVLVLAMQNSVPLRDIGAATSASTFLRSIGGSFGVAIFGSIFSTRLATELAHRLPRAAAPEHTGIGSLTRAQLMKMPPAIRADFLDAFSHALSTVFICAAPIAAIGFVGAFLLRDVPLRGSVHHASEVSDAPEAMEGGSVPAVA